VDCWSGKDVVEVFDISNQPSAIIYADPGNILSCVIQFIVLNSDKESNVQYTWISQGQAYTDSVFTIYEGGTVTLVARDTISLCESKDSITVEALIEYPYILVDSPLPLTCVRTSVILDASGSIPSSGGNFVWTTIAGDTLGTNDLLSVQQAGTYVVELNDPANGCVSFDTIEVIDISVFPELIPANDVELPCDSENQSLNASLITQLPGVTFEWIPRQGGQILGSTDESQVTVRGPGIYIVIATHTASLCTDSDTILVTEITDKPTAIISQVSDTNCEEVADGMIQISDVQGGLEPFTYYIDGIEITEAFITDLAAGTYLLEIEDANGCVLDTLLTVVNGEEVMVDLEAVVNIEAGENHVLMAGVNISSDEIASVKWSPADHLSCDTCLITQASPEEDITYTVTVTDINGCTGEATVTIRVINRTSVFVPNIISPNGDNINDYLTVFTSDAEARVLSMRIFDRWGAVLFEKFTFSPNDPSEGWNGTFNNEPLNPAVFVYMIELELENGIVEILKGDVTVTR
jgi:gliding motility-associated-like protein